jgi:two-component system chemotaxis response regulator CheY
MGRRVLIVDDSANIRQQVREVLAPAGFDVIEAADGVEGVAKLNADPTILVVICDVNMPRKSGLELIEEIKASGVAAHVQILVMTTEDRPRRSSAPAPLGPEVGSSSRSSPTCCSRRSRRSPAERHGWLAERGRRFVQSRLCTPGPALDRPG